MRSIALGVLAVGSVFATLAAADAPPPSGGISVSASVTLGAGPAAPPAGPPAASTPPPPPPPPPMPSPSTHPRQPGEVWLGLGFGNAICDKNKPANECVVGKAGGALDLGGAWRFHPHWAVGAELALFGFNANEAWKGTLKDPSTEVKFSSWYLAPTLRWYWFARGLADPYLQMGFGVGGVTGEAKNATNTYVIKNTGWVLPLAIGVDFHLGERFRLGPQSLIYLHHGTKVCETPDGVESCRDAGKDDGMLAWRFMLMGTVGI